MAIVVVLVVALVLVAALVIVVATRVAATSVTAALGVTPSVAVLVARRDRASRGHEPRPWSSWCQFSVLDT